MKSAELLAVFLLVSFLPKCSLMFLSTLFFCLWVCTRLPGFDKVSLPLLTEEGRRFSCTCGKRGKAEENFTLLSFVPWKVFSNSFLGSSCKGEFCTNLVLLPLSLFFLFFLNATAQVPVIVRGNVPIMATMIKTLEMTYQLEELHQFFHSLSSGSDIPCV